MAKFRKKPVIVEAVRLNGTGDMPEGVNFGTPDPAGYTDGVPGYRLANNYWVNTIEGPLVAQIGDWIITGVNGEQYPCKPGIFAKTYDPVEEF